MHRKRDPAGAVPFDGDSFNGGKARSVSVMGQPGHVIRSSPTPRVGTVIMEHLTHQQNLAHCRRLLAEAELATSSDEIRHSTLMRRLAQEEAHRPVVQHGYVGRTSFPPKLLCIGNISPSRAGIFWSYGLDGPLGRQNDEQDHGDGDQ
jgi:hypothetical protein